VNVDEMDKVERLAAIEVLNELYREEDTNDS
jgi:hypothetical protein